MKTAIASASSAKGKRMGFILFGFVVITAVLIVATAVEEGMTSTASAATAHARATLTARCGMDERTYMQSSPMAQNGLEQQCGAPAEVQP
jgi:hypothetical protein